MKNFLIIFFLFIGLQSFAQSQVYDPNVEYEQAQTLDEVVYDAHGIPVNCSPRDFKKLKREQEREKRKYYGERGIDKVGDGFVSLGRGVGRVAVYIVTGILITTAVNSILR